MAKKAYIGVDNVAHKIKKGYIGVDGIARKIKKAYIGIGGVARPCFSSDPISYWGYEESLDSPRRSLAATTVGKYALFGGGMMDSGVSGAIDVFNTSGTKELVLSQQNLTEPRSYLAATTVGNYALFGGGWKDKGSSNVVDKIDISGVRLEPASSLTQEKGCLAATAVGDIALFGGGYRRFSNGGGGGSDIVDRFSTSGERLDPPSTLSVIRSDLAATTVGNYALFGGGFDTDLDSCRSIVEKFDTSGTRVDPSSSLTYGADFLAATTVGNYALFGGGGSGDRQMSARHTCRDTVDRFDTSGSRIDPPLKLKSARHSLAATTVGKYALFGGGNEETYQYGYNIVADMDIFGASCETIILPLSLHKGRYKLAATTVGDFALFGGGVNSSYSAVVDKYILN